MIRKNKNKKGYLHYAIIILIIYILYKSFYQYREKFVNIYPDTNIKKEKIFISIASYRDDICYKTFKQKIDYTRHKNRKKPCTNHEKSLINQNRTYHIDL